MSKRTTRRSSQGNGATPGPAAEPRVEPVHDGPPPPDPRGVRVTVVGADDLDGVGPVVIEPMPGLLVPGNPSVGVGLLGGVAAIPANVPPPQPEARLAEDGTPVEATLQLLDPVRALLRRGIGGLGHRVLLLDAGTSPASDGATRREVVVDGWRFEVDLEPAARAALRDRAKRGRAEAGKSGPTEVRAIIPGVVVSVSVTAGDEVAAGQQLLVVEAMKMQNELRAPRDGTIERVATSQGATIEVGDLLLVIA